MPELRDALIERIGDVTDRQVWQQAVHALVALIDAGTGADTLIGVLEQLTAADAADDDTDPENDRAAWRRIYDVVGRVLNWSHRAALDADRRALRAAADVLAQHDPFIVAAALLMAETVSLVNDDLGPSLMTLATMTSARPNLGEHLRAAIADAVGREQRWQPDHLLAAAVDLAALGERGCGLLAVGLATGGSRLGWPRVWRGLVQDLRLHPEPDVRDAAMRLALTR
jgi:hypothetical protein